MDSSGSTLEAAYNKNKAELTSHPKTAALVKAFDAPPSLMGYSLDDLRSQTDPGFVQAPGPVVDAPTTAQMASSKQPPSYYLAYNDNDANRILWFKVDVTNEGHEIVSDSGWRSKQPAKS
ncbi:hypothetical protein H4R20_001013 [Coemansia guatemalensis]|uniref:Uncharacterized protein n=1 Tax=Coemansia guatemalensis TaxID=2761395 RepID=A0A9W8HZZ6_9FUNG|nr:hypothetical protein H4R20_001013 [Coemansia guatemalensis]